MPPQIKQAKLREEFDKFIVESPAGYSTKRLISGKYKADAVYEERIGIDGITTKEVADYWLTKLSQAKLETLEAIIKKVEGMNNFRQAKVDGKEDWNNALEQSACKVDALLTKLKAELTLLKNER